MKGRVTASIAVLGASATLLVVAAGPAAAAPINHLYSGTVDGGGTVDVLISQDETEVDVFSANNFGGAGCTSSMARDNIPLSAERYFAYFDTFPTRSITGSLTYGEATGTLRLSDVCDTGNRIWTAEIPVDALIGAKNGSGTIGDGIYSPKGKGQTKSAKARRGRTKAWTFGVERSPYGEAPAPFHAKGCASNSRFKVRYVSEGTNVTADVVSGDFTKLLAPEEVTELRVEMTAKAKARSGSSRTCRLQAIYNAGEAFDVAGVKLTVR